MTDQPDQPDTEASESEDQTGQRYEIAITAEAEVTKAADTEESE